MKRITLYHNPRCSKSREALKMLEQRDIELRVKEYLKEGLESEEVQGLMDMLGEEAVDIVRKKESEYKERPFDINNAKDVIEGLMTYPKLLERPLVVQGKKAIIARPPEKIKDFLEN